VPGAAPQAPSYPQAQPYAPHAPAYPQAQPYAPHAPAYPQAPPYAQAPGYPPPPGYPQAPGYPEQPPQAYPQAPSRGVPDCAPTPVQQSKIYAIQREAAAAGMQVVGVRTIAIGEAVTQQEAFAERMKAAIPFVRGALRTDSLQAFQIRVGNAMFLLTIPWSGGQILPHEFATVVAGTLPTSLIFNRSLLDGNFATSAGENDPLAEELGRVYDLTDGISWDHDEGRLTIKVGWGLQLLPLGDGRIVHVMKTAQHGIFSKDFALPWYAKKVTAFSTFLATRPASAEPPSPSRPGPANFLQMPMSALFLDALGVAF